MLKHFLLTINMNTCTSFVTTQPFFGVTNNVICHENGRVVTNASYECPTSAMPSSSAVQY